MGLGGCHVMQTFCLKKYGGSNTWLLPSRIDRRLAALLSAGVVGALEDFLSSNRSVLTTSHEAECSHTCI